VGESRLNYLSRQAVIVSYLRNVAVDSFEMPHEGPDRHRVADDAGLGRPRSIGVRLDVLFDQFFISHACTLPRGQ
jgi:hypothetical protein